MPISLPTLPLTLRYVWIVESDQLLKLLRTCFMSETSDATGSAWNEQREIIIHRALTGVAYQQVLYDGHGAPTRVPP